MGFETSSIPSSSEDDDHVEDSFDLDGIGLPGLKSSTVPLVMEVTRRNPFGSQDPLFQGRCLYSGTMSKDQVKEYSVKHGVKTSDESTPSCQKQAYQIPWYFLSVLGRILKVRQR